MTAVITACSKQYVSEFKTALGAGNGGCSLELHGATASHLHACTFTGTIVLWGFSPCTGVAELPSLVAIQVDQASTVHTLKLKFTGRISVLTSIYCSSEVLSSLERHNANVCPTPTVVDHCACEPKCIYFSYMGILLDHVVAVVDVVYLVLGYNSTAPVIHLDRLSEMYTTGPRAQTWHRTSEDCNTRPDQHI